MSNGSIKDYTPKFGLIIPQFNIATWHDYIEENFRSIDALFYNLFDIQNYKGQWKQLTEYFVDEVIFVGEDFELEYDGTFKLDDQGNKIKSIFSGRLVKVLVEHTTDNSEYFSQFYNKHKDYYEFFVDAATSQIFAEEAKTAAKESQGFAKDAETSATSAKNSENSAKEVLKEIQSGASLNIDTDPTLSANSDEKIASQKAIKTYVDDKVGNIETLLHNINSGD